MDALWINRLLRILGDNWPPAFQHDARQHVDGCAVQFLRCLFESKRVRATASPFLRLAAFVLPISLVDVDDINAPDHDFPSLLHRLGRIDVVAPDDIPTGMVIMRLHRPRSKAAL